MTIPLKVTHRRCSLQIMAESKYKPLSFNTTMRNPERIAFFLSALLEYEGQTLNNKVIDNVVRSLISKKLYCPNVFWKTNEAVHRRLW